MPFQFNQKTLVISCLLATAFGFLAYTSSVLANHYATFPSTIMTLEGAEPCKDVAECDAICDNRGAAPMGCFYFYGDTGLAPQKADYFKKIVNRAERALQQLITEGKPGGSLTEEKFNKYYIEHSIADGFNQSLANPSNPYLSKKGIRNSLIQNGWPSKDVDQAFITVEQMSKEEFREVSKLFNVEGIYLNNGVGSDGQLQLKNLIRIGGALEQAARKNLKPPSVCSYGLMCFSECSADNRDLSPECKNYLKETGYANDRTIALAQLIAAKSTDEVGGGPGGCFDLAECEVYCDAEEHWDECIEFTDKNNLSVEVPDDKKAVFEAMKKGEGPGQCKDEVSCRTYCEDIANINECVSFVEKFNLADPDELREMRQMANVYEAGVSFPGSCTTKESCLQYCENSAHQVECMEFAQKAGFIPEEDQEAVSKIIPYLKSGGTLPGGCTTKESCDAYCGSETNINECMDFAVGAGFMTKEEAEIVKKVGGKGPGDCKSRESCDNYCKDETHTDECIEFAVKAGFISQEDAQMAKKFGISSGPGDCKSKAECQSFCAVPENQEACSNWAKEHGMDVSGEGGQMGGEVMEEMKKCAQATSCNEFMSCMKGIQEKFGGGEGETEGNQESGGPSGLPDDVVAKMNSCISQMQQSGGGEGGGDGGSYAPPGGGGEQGQPQQGQMTGEQCAKYGGQWDGSNCIFPQQQQQQNQQDFGGEECVKQGGNWDGANCMFPQQQTQQPDCSTFEQVPKCEYITDPKGYEYCKQCYPDR